MRHPHCGEQHLFIMSQPLSLSTLLSVRSPELGLVQTTAELGTALVAFSPLGRSLLTDRPHSSVEVEKMDWLSKNPRFNEPNLTFNIEATGKFRDLAAQNGVAAATLAIAWLLNKNKHIIPIPGTVPLNISESIVRAPG